MTSQRQSTSSHQTANHSDVPTTSGMAYVAKRRLGAGDDAIWPGELVNTTDWPERIVNVHVDLGWITPMMVTDASRAELAEQWEQQEARREERRKLRPVPEPPPPPPEPPKPPARRLYCKTCTAPHDFAEVPADEDKFQCHRCNQLQAVSEARTTSGYGWHGAT
jgi:hypothetical protein